jgi:thiol-disulfide isomerase/thioredoxin
MRRCVFGCLAAVVLVGCSSGNPNPDPKSMDPNTMPTVMEPPAKPVYEELTYPEGPYGKEPGSVLADVTFQAFLPNAPKQQLGQIALHDFFDPDGSRGINALVIISSAEWCGACMAEAMTLESKIKSKWGADGVQVIELIIEDTQMRRDMASVEAAADRWRAKFSLTDMIVGLDPAFTYAHSGTNGLPLNVLVDPRTMTMVVRQDGAGGTIETKLSSLVAKNKIQ